MRIANLGEIKAALSRIDLMPAIEAGFRAYSDGRANVPPVGELIMDKGDAHIKYGCITGDPYYVIKIATGFHGNPALGLPPGNGMMLVFNQATGAPVAILLDEGYLTDVRTAVAGAIAAKYLAPRKVDRIGIIGTGVQARMQLEQLMPVTDCRDVVVAGRSREKLTRYRVDMEAVGFSVETTVRTADVAATCNLIVTATLATEPVIWAGDIRPGTHITAMGSDTPDKQELDAAILAQAALVVADSIPQGRLRGEIFKALEARAITEDGLVEIGRIIAGTAPGRTSNDQITVFDSTGVAVQDIMIATGVLAALGPE